MRATTAITRGAGRRPLRGARLAIAGLVAVVAALALPGVAGAATHSGSVSGINVTPALSGHGTFGLYHFNVGATNADPFAYPFSTGAKIGHSVDAAAEASNDGSDKLRTGSDLSLDNGDTSNTIGHGFTIGAQRVEWILLSSVKNSPGDATGVQGAGHQSAIWHLTNPSSTSLINVTGSSANEKAAAARAAQLLTDSGTYYKSVNNTADLSIDGGGALQTCSNTSRTVTVTGSPWTDATLTITGSGVFHVGGGTSTTVNLGATGVAQVQIDSTGPGQVDISASVKVATMVQANTQYDAGSVHIDQDFVYVEFQTSYNKVSLVFNNCQNLALSKTANPGFVRTFDWNITKSVNQTTVTTANDTATFTYTVVATKSAAVDSGWNVTGAISVTNPNAFAVGDVVITEQGVDNGGTCVLNATGAIGSLAAGQTASVPYTCSYAAAPTAPAGTNTANVAWTVPAVGGTTPMSTSVMQNFVFGNPTTTLHNSVNVSDAFAGAAGSILDGGANLASSKTFIYTRTVAVPATACKAYDNTATVTDTSISKSAQVTVTTCRTPPVHTTSVPNKTTISLSKTADSPSVKAGGTVGFKIRWKNTGKTSARNVVICDDLPSQMTFVSAKGAAFKNGKACWTRKSVAKGATLTFRVVARVNASVNNATLVNVATATASNAKPATAKAPVRALRNERTRAGGVTG